MLFTLVPITILSIIAAPSISLMFMLEESVGHLLFFNVIGHQWWWEYEIPLLLRPSEGETIAGRTPEEINKHNNKLYKEGEFKRTIESYYIWEEDLQVGQKWLYETEEALILPAGIKIKLGITSFDVIHSWTVRGFGVKIDAVPGRMNALSFTVKRCGNYFGMCSEICGSYHAFMPIHVKAVSPMTYISTN